MGNCCSSKKHQVDESSIETKKPEMCEFESKELEDDFNIYLDKKFDLPTKKEEVFDAEGKLLCFPAFVKYYKGALVWHKILNTQSKNAMIKERRIFLRKQEKDAYNAAIKKTNGADADRFIVVFGKMIQKTGFNQDTEELYQRSLMKFMADEEKVQQIQQIRLEVEEGKFQYFTPRLKMITNLINKKWKETNEEMFLKESSEYGPIYKITQVDLESMTKKEAIDFQNEVFQVFLSHFRELKEIKDFEELQGQLMVVAQVMGDKLYFKYGVESEEMDAMTERLKLEEDPQYQELVQNYTKQVQELQIGQ